MVEDNGYVLAESGAILEYLQETYDSDHRFRPQAMADKLQYRFWLHYAEGSLMPLMVMKLVFASFGKPPIPLGMRTLGNAPGKGVQKAGWTGKSPRTLAILRIISPVSRGLPARSSAWPISR